MPLIPALRRQRQVDLCKFMASLVYRVSSRSSKDTERNPVLKKKWSLGAESAQYIGNHL